MTLPLHVSFHIYDHLQGGSWAVLYAVTKLNSVDVSSLFAWVGIKAVIRTTCTVQHEGKKKKIIACLDMWTLHQVVEVVQRMWEVCVVGRSMAQTVNHRPLTAEARIDPRPVHAIFLANGVSPWLSLYPRPRPAPPSTMFFPSLYGTLTEVFLNLTEVFLTLTEVFLTLTEVFPCFFPQL